MTQDERQALAARLMDEFAADTGLSGGAPARRYLWTDAFAVCNFLGLHRITGEKQHLDRALLLVDQVHHVLGRHRADDPRQGWLSGLDGEEAEAHPTRGGLRIGKPGPERGADERYDARGEWDRDGQYLHYLTQWMHALHRLAEDTGVQQFSAWAIELAQAAHAAFSRGGGHAGSGGYAWKMSVDLQRAQVTTSGQHDAIDALVSFLELDAGGRSLVRETEAARRMAGAATLVTDDALGIGSLLLDACRLARLGDRVGRADGELKLHLLSAAMSGLEAFVLGRELDAPAGSRLAFRELGLAIGLHALEHMAGAGFDTRCRAVLAQALDREPLAYLIDAFWMSPSNRRVASWTSHRDINSVMLATSLLPSGYLGR